MQKFPLQSVEPANVIRTGDRPLERLDDLHAAAAARARWWFLVGSAWILGRGWAGTGHSRPIGSNSYVQKCAKRRKRRDGPTRDSRTAKTRPRGDLSAFANSGHHACLS